MREPIRILHVLGRLDRGGAETMVMNLYRHMDRQQVQFDFVLHTAEECSYTQEVLQLGGRIYAVPAYSPKTAGKYRRAWRQFLKEHTEYRILHSHVRSTASLYLPLAKKYGMTTIMHSHNTSSGKGLAAVVKTIFQYPLRFQADYLFACGREAGEWLYGKMACRSQRFVVLPNAIDLTQFQWSFETRKEVRRMLSVDEKTLVIGHIGRFEQQKNHSFLVKIFEEVRKIESDSTLLLIGEGVLRTAIEAQVASSSTAGHVRFLGSRNDVNQLLQGMDVFLFPSLFEGLPVTLIEAQAAGLVVIMSDAVTSEIKITDLIDECKLKEAPEVWAKRIVDKWHEAGDAGAQKDAQGRIGGQEDHVRKLRAAGYDIKETSKWLMRFYKQIIE